MKQVVTVRNVKIGEGIPKICVPIIGSTREEILSEARAIKGIRRDIVEWRADWFENVSNMEEVKEVALALREELQETPILFTFRTAKEGGEGTMETEAYVSLNKEMAASGLVDLIDVELFTGEQQVREVVEAAHSYQAKVICSNHDFHKTPPKEEILARLIRMQELGADLPKIAVMPQSTRDVLELLLATEEMTETYADRPVITMSMSGIGTISRIAGEVFGSALTFGAAKKASAPGQIEADQLGSILEVLHAGIS